MSDESGFNGRDRNVLRALQEQMVDLRLEMSERMISLEVKVEHMDETLAAKVGKEAFAPVKWLIYTIVAAAVMLTVGAILRGAQWAPQLIK